jgi:hypothetical protein
MFRKMLWWAVVLSVGLLPAGGTARAQDYALPDPNLPLPLGSTRPEDGGFFAGLSYTMYRMTNPLKAQEVAVRGFLDVDGSINQAVNGFQAAHTFFGSSREALNVQQVTGPNHYVPGFNVELGWKFADGAALTIGWMYFFETKKTAVATVAPPGLVVGNDLADSFLFSPVFNFPSQYAGTPGKIGVGNPLAAYGIWNGASLMTIDFEQHFQQWEATYRMPLYQDECMRLNGMVGPRFAWIWERFRWTTMDLDAGGNTDPSTEAIYTNIVSNRMYGFHVGSQVEYYMGYGFACMLDLQGAAFLNIVKERAKYELGAKLPPVNKRALTDFSFVPEVQGTASVMWYPIEGVQFKLSYDVLAFFNTISMQDPIDFNYSALTPEYTHWKPRFFDGIQASIAIWF